MTQILRQAQSSRATTSWATREASPHLERGANGRPAGAKAASREWLAARVSGPMAPGSVLMHAATEAFQAPGGGENQLVRSGRHLEARGVAVRPFVPWVDRVEEARLLHLFGMSREGLALARVAKARGVPVVLSPICWFEPAALLALAPGPARAARDLLAYAVRRACPRIPGWRREMLAMADAILPNSEAEADQLVRLFGADRDAIRVVPNGVEPRFAGADPSVFRAEHGDSDFVLYVGRIEPRKNVLGLVRGAGLAGLPLVVIGDPLPGRESYAAACREAGGGSVRWLARIEHDDPALASAYAAARVFALPSWFETPGLAALEAGLAGCAVVSTPYGCTREYFGDRAVYARPGRAEGVAAALLRAWDEGPAPDLAGHIRSRFLWAEVARRTAEAYDQVGG